MMSDSKQSKPQENGPERKLFHVTLRELTRVNRLLRAEFTSGLFVIIAAATGFIAANSWIAPSYVALRDTRIGPAALHLDLTVGQWAADGLLAVFFFIVGLELKRELTFGALSKLNVAIVPVVAAVAGVIIPAVLYLTMNFGDDSARGWAIPAATDIAFAVAVLGLIAPRIPPMLRVFLLTLAVVDDLIAITIIAVFYTNEVNIASLLASIGFIAVYGVVVQVGSPLFQRVKWLAWVILLPIGFVAWAFMHASGIHATIAGVLLAFTVPVTASRRRSKTTQESEEFELAHQNTPNSDLAGLFAHRFELLSTVISVPIFAFFAAGVSLSGESRFPFDPIAIGIMIGLVIGKPVGIVVSTWALTKFTRAEFAGDVSWRELWGVGALGGIGFTVAMLVAELSFNTAADADTARLAVMVGSLISAGVASVLLVRPQRARTNPLKK